jgi:aspartate/methionine/tyrosine aminotransferase
VGLTAPLPDFRLEVHFARWEFEARHNLTASDAQTMTVAELLELGGDGARAAFDELALGYIPTWGTDRLRAAIAATYEVCGPDDVLVFAGAEEAMFWALQLLAEPGDHAVVSVPNYQSLETMPGAAGIELTGVLLDERDGWRLHLDQVEAALSPNTKLVAVNFPNNPTGAVPDAGTFAGLVELCEDRGIRLFSDEVYRGVELDMTQTLPQAADLSPTALSLNVMSKSYGLPGLRIGWLACRDHEVLERLERHKHYTTICNSGPSELLAAIALEAGERIQARTREIIAANLPQFDAFFARHPDLFEWAPPQGGCVTFPRYSGAEGVEELCRGLVERAGVLLLPASLYRSGLAAVPEDRFRIGVGRRDPGPALEAFDAYLAG